MQQFHFRSLSGLNHAISSRHGGVSTAPYSSLNLGYGTADDEDNVHSNRTMFFRSMGLGSENVVAARLTHGAEVSVFQRSAPDEYPVERLAVRNGSTRAEAFFSTDGAVSDVPGLYLLLTFADCVPLVFFDPAKGVMGVAHAGWRGTAARVGPETVQTMARVFGSRSSDMLAGIGPSIGPCCYTVGSNVLHTFDSLDSEPVVHRRNGETFLDLWETNIRQLQGAGLETIECGEICTSCNVDTYFSHRAEGGKTGRFGMVAGLSET